MPRAPPSTPVPTAQTALAVANQALSLVRRLDRQVEEKFHQVSLLNFDYTTGYIYSPSGVPQGITDVTRIGDKIRAKRLEVRVRMYDNTNSNTCFRMIILRQKEYAAFSITNLVEADSTLSFHNNDQADRWIILKDMVVQQNSSFANQDRGDTYIFTIPLDYELSFTGAAGSDYESGPLWIYTTADYSGPAGSGIRPVSGEAAMDIRTRLFFTDL